MNYLLEVKCSGWNGPKSFSTVAHVFAAEAYGVSSAMELWTELPFCNNPPARTAAAVKIGCMPFVADERGLEKVSNPHAFRFHEDRVRKSINLQLCKWPKDRCFVRTCSNHLPVGASQSVSRSLA